MSSIVRYSSRKISQDFHRKTRHCHVLFVVLAIIIQRSHIKVKAECRAHGCPLTAIDIIHDEYAKEALSVLRRIETKRSIDNEKGDGDHSNGNNRNSDLRENALSALQPAGDDSKTTMTLRGYKGGEVEDQINQDRAVVVSPLNILPDSSKSKPVAQLLGVFDGHGRGGEKTSQYAVEHVPSLLAAKLTSIILESENNQGGQRNVDNELEIIEALKQTFDEVDKNDPSRGSAGCTATVVLRLEHKLFVANAGDSVSFVGVYFGGQSLSTPVRDNVQIVYQSREDKPDLPEEKARIIAAGGYVDIPLDENHDVPRALDENRRYGLAMSRSLGDWKVLGVIAEPIVDVLDLSEIVQKALGSYTESCSNNVNNKENTNEKNRYCDFVDNSDIHIFATSISDGMMDYLSPNDIGKTLATSFFDQDSNLHPHSAAEKLVIDAAKGWEDEFRGEYRDDIAIASFVVPYL